MKISDILFPIRCVAVGQRGKPCNHPVDHEGGICQPCWKRHAGSPQISVRLAVARSPQLPPSQLIGLSHDLVMAVRIAVAERDDLPVDIQQTIAKDRDVAVVRTIAANPNLSDETLQLLYKHPDQLVQRQLQIVRSQAV